MFDERLLELLLNGGAPLSRHLVQLLHLLHNGSLLGQKETKWGASIKFSAFTSVMTAARTLYGDEIAFGEGDIDERTIADTLRDLRADEPLPAKVVDILTRFRWMPLPLSLRAGRFMGGRLCLSENGPPETVVERALVDMPLLAPLIVANGELEVFCSLACAALTHLRR